MKITWYGTASVAIRTRQSEVLTDPFIPWRGSPAPVTAADFDGFSRILVTHGHFDHIESIPEIVTRNPSAAVCCTKTPYRTLRKKGVRPENLKRIAPWLQTRFGDMTIRTWPCCHADLWIDLKDRLKDPGLYHRFYNLPHAFRANRTYPENHETLMYEIMAEGKRILLLGSMNLLPDVRYPSDCDLLILPYVGYEDNLAQAKWIISRLNPEKVLLTHFDNTFPPLTRGEDTAEIVNAGLDCEILVPEYKKSIEIGQPEESPGRRQTWRQM